MTNDQCRCSSLRAHSFALEQGHCIGRYFGELPTSKELTSVLRDLGERLPYLKENAYGVLLVCCQAADEIERLQRELAASQDRERQLVKSVELRDRELDESKAREGQTYVDACNAIAAREADAVSAPEPRADEPKVSGTYACPICGKDNPHDHKNMVGKFTVGAEGVYVDYPNGQYHQATMTEMGDEIRRLSNLLERSPQPQELPHDAVHQYAYRLKLVPDGEIVPIQMISVLRRQLEAARAVLPPRACAEADQHEEKSACGSRFCDECGTALTKRAECPHGNEPDNCAGCA